MKFSVRKYLEGVSSVKTWDQLEPKLLLAGFRKTEGKTLDIFVVPL